MTNHDQPTIADILSNALQVISEVHGLAITTIRVEWTNCHSVEEQWPMMVINNMDIEGKPCQTPTPTDKPLDLPPWKL